MNKPEEKPLPLLFRWMMNRDCYLYVLQTIARFHGNILTIHQSIPINGVATLTLSVDILPGEGDAEAIVDEIERQGGVHYLKILGRE